MVSINAFVVGFLSGSVSGLIPSSIRPSVRYSRGRLSRSSLMMSNALIVQNKGGGHGELGYQLAKNLSSNQKITSVTILQDDACNYGKEPFKSYASDISDVRVVNAKFADDITAADLQNILGNDSYDYIWDNASKGDEGVGKAVVDSAKQWGTKLLTYVSSAGMYQPTEDTSFPMAETTPIKESAGQAKYDAYAVAQGVPYVSFRPQYIYGRKANKYDYIDWFFDRLERKLPLPIPGDGTQKVSLTNSEDVASLLASVLNDEEAAVKQRFFNCGTENLVGYDEVVKLCADTANISRDEVSIKHYDAAALGKGTFPFRPTNFYVSPDMAKEKLGWKGSSSNLKDDLSWYYEGYKSRGGPTKELSLEKDEAILNSI